MTFYNRATTTLTALALWALTGLMNMAQAQETSIKDTTQRSKSVYDFSLLDTDGRSIPLSTYQGKVILIVNTATGCGFTPQYNELEDVYQRMRDQGLEILDIPCNQFGQQAPGSDEEIKAFCQLHFGTEFPQFKKSDVNGDNQLPLYSWLKSEQGFKGFDLSTKIGQAMANMLSKKDPNWEKSSDIKWNFTKFLINRQGQVVARFEPMISLAEIEPFIKAELDKKR